MSIRKYRLASADTVLGRFWNDKKSGIQYAFLNSIKDESLEIQQYQLTKIKMYQQQKTKYRDTQKALDRLNYDVKMYFKSYSSNIDVVNTIIEDLKKRVEELYASTTKVENLAKTAEYTWSNLSAADAKVYLSQVDNIFLTYEKILILLQDYQNQPMLAKYLEIFNEEFDNLISSIPIKNSELIKFNPRGYIGKLGGLSVFLKGFIGEESLVKDGIAKLPVPLGVKNTGTLMVKYGNQTVASPADFIVYSMKDLDLAKNISIEYQLGEGGPIKTCTLEEFMTKVLTNRKASIILTENNYEILCRNALATLQAKFFSKNVKSIVFKSGSSGQDFSQIEEHFNTDHIKALKLMLELNKASENAEGHTKSLYFWKHQKYQNFIDYSLGSNIGYIFGDNSFMVTGEKGIETVWDFAKRKYSEGYMLKWGTAKEFNLHYIDSGVRRPILLTKANS